MLDRNETRSKKNEDRMRVAGRVGRRTPEPGASWAATVGRHAVIGSVTLLLVTAFQSSRSEWHPMHAWNRAFADASLVLLVIVLAAGPLARLTDAAGPLVRARRELGVWTVLAAAAHVWIVFDQWVEGDVARFWQGPGPAGLVFDPGFAAGNLVGLAALVYGVVLLATSNDWAQRFLGGAGWKFVQQRSTTYFVLVALHTAYFLFLHFEFTFHRPVPAPNWFRTPFLLLIGALLLLQTVAFAVTVRRERQRTAAPSRRR